MDTKQKVVVGVIAGVGVLVGAAMLWEALRSGSVPATAPMPAPAPTVLTQPAGTTPGPQGPVTPLPAPSGEQPSGPVDPTTKNPSPQPAPSPTTTTIENDRIRFGPQLPFPVPNVPGLETEGGGLLAGEARFARGESGSAMITRLVDADGQVWVMVEMEPSNKKSLLGRSIATAERVVPPYLIVEGAEGHVGAVGLVYEDSLQRVVLVEPQLGLRGISVVPPFVATRTDQKLWLLFRAPKGGVIRSLWFGRKKKAEWEPGVKIPG